MLWCDKDRTHCAVHAIQLASYSLHKRARMCVFCRCAHAATLRVSRLSRIVHLLAARAHGVIENRVHDAAWSDRVHILGMQPGPAVQVASCMCRGGDVIWRDVM